MGHGTTLSHPKSDISDFGILEAKSGKPDFFERVAAERQGERLPSM